jgi:hypothetical protein
MCPFCLVSAVDQTTVFYSDKLGSEARYQEPHLERFLAIVRRDLSLHVTPGANTVPPAFRESTSRNSGIIFKQSEDYIPRAGEGRPGLSGTESTNHPPPKRNSGVSVRFAIAPEATSSPGWNENGDRT